MNIANWLTLTRIALIPLLVGVYYLPDPWLTIRQANIAATVFFTVGALTDWLDGWIARRMNLVSPFGEFLDPVADKLMVATSLVLLLDLERIHSLVAIIIIGREITISALREWMAKIGSTRSVAVSILGKLKTTIQLIAIPMLFFNAPLWVIPIPSIGFILIWIATLLTIWSMLYYLYSAWQAYKVHRGSRAPGVSHD